MNIDYNNIIYIILFIAASLIIFQLGRNSIKCPPPTASFKYLPRDFNLDSNYPDMVSYQFKDLFEKPTPYLIALDNNNKRELI